MFKNLTSGAFSAESDLVIIKIKDSARDEVFQTTIPNDYSVSMLPNPTFLRTVETPIITGYTFETIEWFEIYYGGMLVAHVVPSETN